LRILFLNSEAELYNNGSDKILLLSLDALRGRHHVEAILPEPGPLVGAIRSRGIECQVISYPILRRGHLAAWRLPRFLWQLLASTWHLRRVVRERDIDVVYANTLSVMQGALLRPLVRCRHVWHVHDYVDEPRVANWFLSWLASAGADIVICVSGAVERHLGTRSGNSKVVWNGIPPLVPGPSFERPPGPVTVSVVGRFNRLKGQHHMVAAARMMEDDSATAGRFRVRLVGGTYKGEDRYRQAVVRQIAQLRLEHVVRIEESVEDVAPVYLGSDIVVVPSDRPDPFPTVALESMSVGTPVIAHAAGGMPEMLDFDADCLVERGNAAELASKVSRMIVDRPFRLTKARQQHDRYRRHFLYEHFVARLQSALDAVPPVGRGAACPQ
jgi:glycosyltransferase involved in cell wall biosynthesis